MSHARRNTFDVEEWITSCINSPEAKGGSGRLRYMSLSLGSAEGNEARRVRNESLGAGVWSLFEAVRVRSVIQAAKEILMNIPTHLRHHVHVSLAGNYANRMALLSGYHPDSADVVKAIGDAFPPSIINISISVQTPEAMHAVVAASDAAMVRLKNVVDRSDDAHSDRVNSCVIVPTAAGGSMMVDVPAISGRRLKPTAYSVSRNSSSREFMLTRLRRSVRAGKERFQLPLVDMTAFFAPPDVATAPVQLPYGRMHIPIGFDLLRHFSGLLRDPEIQQSPSKLAHCQRAMALLHTIFPDVPPRFEPEPFAEEDAAAEDSAAEEEAAEQNASVAEAAEIAATHEDTPSGAIE